MSCIKGDRENHTWQRIINSCHNMGYDYCTKCNKIMLVGFNYYLKPQW